MNYNYIRKAIKFYYFKEILCKINYFFYLIIISLVFKKKNKVPLSQNIKI